MDCPVCGEKLREIDRYGVLVDICPGCKGCWLDRGELEKIAALEESGFQPAAVERAAVQRDPVDRSRDYRERDDRDDHDHDHKKDDDDHYDRGSRSGESGYGKPKKRSSLLGDILGSLGGE
jgi:Zn-finger nucleic acid-binding protein